MENYQKVFLIRIAMILALVMLGSYFSITHNFVAWGVIFSAQIAHLLLIISRVDEKFINKFLD